MFINSFHGIFFDLCKNLSWHVQEISFILLFFLESLQLLFSGKNRKITWKILESPGIWKKHLCGHHVVWAEAFPGILTGNWRSLSMHHSQTLFHQCSDQTLKNRWYQACPLPGLGVGLCSRNQELYQWTIQLFEIISQYNLY